MADVVAPAPEKSVDVVVDTVEDTPPASSTFVPLRSSPKPRDYRGAPVSPRTITTEPTTFAVKLKPVGSAQRSLSPAPAPRSPPLPPLRADKSPARARSLWGRMESAPLALKTEDISEHLATKEAELAAREIRANLKEAALSVKEEQSQALGAQESQLAAREKELKEKEEAMEERERARKERESATGAQEEQLMLREQTMRERESVLGAEEQKLDQREKHCKELGDALAVEEAKLEAREKQFKERESVLVKEEAKLDEREQQCKERERVVSEREQVVNGREIAVSERESEVSGRESALSVRESETTFREAQANARESAVLVQEAQIDVAIAMNEITITAAEETNNNNDEDSENNNNNNNNNIPGTPNMTTIITPRASSSSSSFPLLSGRRSVYDDREAKLAMRESAVALQEAKNSAERKRLSDREEELVKRESHALLRPSLNYNEREQHLILQERQLVGQVRRFRAEEDEVLAQQQEWTRILESLAAREADLSAQAQSLISRESQLKQLEEKLQQEQEVWLPQIQMVEQRESRVVLREKQIDNENQALARLSAALKTQKADITALYTTYSKMERLCSHCLLDEITSDVVMRGPAIREVEAKLRAATEAKNPGLVADLRELLNYVQCVACEAAYIPDSLFCAQCGGQRPEKRPSLFPPPPPPPPSSSSSSSSSASTSSGSTEVIHFPGLSNSLREGYLVKRGGTVKTWKRRYFVLQHTGKLMYFEHSDGKKLCGQMVVGRLSTVGFKEHPTGFWLCPLPNGRVFELEADDIESRKGWVDALEKLLGPNEPRQWDKTVVPYLNDGKLVVEKL